MILWINLLKIKFIKTRSEQSLYKDKNDVCDFVIFSSNH